MSAILFVLTILAALVEWAAIFKGWRRLEYFAKPGVIVFLLAWLLAGRLESRALFAFGLGLLFSLAGDILLLLSNERRWFMFGLGAFFFAHLAYIVGFNVPPPPFSPLTFAVGLIILVSVLPLIRRILLGVRQKGLRRLLEPVRAYANVISVMLFSALMTLFRSDWQSGPAYLVSLGALMLISSDVLLAWNKFVRPVRRGRLVLMILYHIGQVALIAGAAAQFGG